MRAELREYIDSKINQSSNSFSDQDSLYELRILDSLGVIQLMDYIRTELAIVFQPNDCSIDNFDSIDSIISFIEKKQKEIDCA